MTHQEVTTRLLRRNYTQEQIQRMLEGELLNLVKVEELQTAGTSARVWKITDRGYEALGHLRRRAMRAPNR